MNTLEAIQSPIKEELIRQNSLLKESLRSDVELVNSVVDYFLEKKGKMLRPIMVLLAARLVSSEDELNENAIRSAVAVELLHNASLIHDDIVDETLERRGRKSVNAIWDNKVSVLVGDLFLSRCLVVTNQTRSLAIQGVLASLSSALAEGELKQLETATSKLLSEKAYFSVISNKTASLFVACMKVGALSVKAGDQEIERLARLGEKLGLIFQIRDDIFDYFDSAEIGKPTGNDIREGKVTLPLLHCLLEGVGEQADRMRELLQKDSFSADEIVRLVSFARENGGIDYAHQVMLRLADEAKSILYTFPESLPRHSFELLINYVIERKY